MFTNIVDYKRCLNSNLLIHTNKLGDTNFLPYPNDSITYNIQQINAKLNKQSATVLSGTVTIPQIYDGFPFNSIVTFSTPFSSKPTVTVVCNNNTVTVTASEINAGSFKIRATCSSGNIQSNAKITWTAVLEN